MKEKVAFVSARYGPNMNGGAEQHCRMLAERLVSQYEVEVLTTCVENYRSGGNELAEGEEMVGGVKVRRFLTDNSDSDEERRFAKKAKHARRIRHLLFRTGILPLISSFCPVWKPGMKTDEAAQAHSLFYSSGMRNFIKNHKNEYKCFIVFTVDYAPFYITAMEAGDKTIAIPTLHNAKISFRPSLTKAFSKIRYVGFNTPAEQKLGKRIFGAALGASGIIGCGIEPATPGNWEEIKSRYGLPDNYLLYIGRVDKSKTGDILKYYRHYRRENGTATLPLVIVGGIYDTPENTDGLYLTGFVSDSEKRSILQHSTILINPSYYESLSLVVLEALYDKIPVLVNGRCNVLKEHCIFSNGAVRYYMNCRDFRKELETVTADCHLRDRMSAAGRKYYEEYYEWNVVLPRLYEAINNIDIWGTRKL